jgi:poly(hydroxyalkanoate) depolymerase family esterase
MTKSFASGMAMATELTRAGKLKEATALIQSLLGGADQQATPESDGQLIEGQLTRLEDAAPTKPAKPQRPKPQRPSKPSATPRAPLAATLRKLVLGGMVGPARLSTAAVDLPQGAQFLTLTHTSAEGSRTYRLYIPANRTDAPMPLIVMLHGCTQTPEDFAKCTGMNALAEEFGCLVAYPAQTSAANMQNCWNWFRPEDQGRGRGEPALIAGLTRDILRDHGGDPDWVYIAGLSAGGAAAAIVAAAYPDIFAAAGVHSGLATGSARDVPSAFGAMRTGSDGIPYPDPIPTIVFHGLADTTVHPSNGNSVRTQAAGKASNLKATTTAGTSAGGRAYRQIKLARPDGRVMVEHWEISGAGHAWAGGSTGGSYTDPNGPNASREMLRFFLSHAKG